MKKVICGLFALALVCGVMIDNNLLNVNKSSYQPENFVYTNKAMTSSMLGENYLTQKNGSSIVNNNNALKTQQYEYALEQQF